MKYNEINRKWIISLPNSERRKDANIELSSNDIYFNWFDAYKKDNGADALKYTMHDIFFRTSLYNDENSLIFEDDILFCCDNPKEEIIKAIADLPEDYDLCKFGANLLAPVTKVTDNLNKISMSYALHAVLYSRKGIEKILQVINQPEPIDVIIAKHIEPQGNCYVSSKMIATQRPGKSDIFKFDPKIHNANSIKEIYNPETEVVNWHNLMVSQWERNTKHLK